ncbi:hypothetical protein ACA910_010181, partial [Epithemia clementina (nom. ined.)]
MVVVRSSLRWSHGITTGLWAWRKTTEVDSNFWETERALTTERDACGVGFIANPKLAPSHAVLQLGLSALSCMEHRGACGGDRISGDGAGIMTQIPRPLFADFYSSTHNPSDGAANNGESNNKKEVRGVGMVFLPRNAERRQAVQTVLEDVCRANELDFVGWREVPVNPDVLGPLARQAMPSIYQFFVQPPSRQLASDDDESGDDFERTLYLVRRRFSVELDQRGLLSPPPTQETKDKAKEEEEKDNVTVYVASFSSRTIVYKGMVQAEVLPQFYLDLQDDNYKTQFVLYHRRFSTNTNPQWQLAQPMRVVGHNGEINTLLGNVNWIKAREAAKSRPYQREIKSINNGKDSTFSMAINGDNMVTLDSNAENEEDDDDDDYGKVDTDDLVDSRATSNIVELCNTQDIPAVLEPLVDVATRSDSANLDAVFELMTMSRHRAPCALMALVPAAYHNDHPEYVNTNVADFYQFHGGLLEAWDGPALLVFSDGKSIGASLDRNGLRPARYSMDDEGTVYVMSETGVIPGLDDQRIVQKGRLGPGQMINVDLTTGEFKDNVRIKQEIAKRHPYGEWLARQRVNLDRLDFSSDRLYEDDATATYAQATFGWSLEDINMQIADMAGSAKETTYSMGDDAPLSVLSEYPHPLYNYFKQRFAQVTNPPIDPLREGVVMSLVMTLGKKQSIYKVSEKGARLIHLDSPILNSAEMEALSKLAPPHRNNGFAQATISTRYPLSNGPTGLKEALDALCDQAVQLVRKEKVEVLILSDKASAAAVLEET